MACSVARNLLLLLTLGLPVLSPVADGEEQLDYETIRFYTSSSKPEQLQSYALSPDGRYLALSFNRRHSGVRPGVSIVDLQRLELVRQTGKFSFFTLAFSSDSQKILGIGGYAGTQLFDVENGSVQKVNLTNFAGKIGINLGEKNGKLLVTNVTSESNPTIGDQIRVGDELLAINEGDTPTRYDDAREWEMLAGKPLKKALEMMAGKPGTWVQLRLARRGSSQPIDVSVQRQWPANKATRTLPDSDESLTLSVGRGVFQFCSADRRDFVAFISLRDLERTGQMVVSPDGKKFAALAQTVGNGDYCLELHDLMTGKLEQSATFDATNYRHMRFSPDSGRVLIGTRDTVEVFDIASTAWLEPVVLTPPEDVDQGRVVTRRIPLGFGLPGDLYTTSRAVVYAKPAALAQFDVSPSGTLAIGSETGEIVLASLETKERVGLLGDNILGAKPEMIEFSPTGKHLVAFAKGMLHIFALDETNSEITPESPVRP